ncbi:MAG: sulfite reductase subunit A, partial [Acidobacteriota bacterium]|nr:sulfite reductase subunit A [Acidobacteriota bacterium]
MPERTRTRFPAERIADLIQALAGRGYQVIGPTVRDGAVVYEEIADGRDLPRGWGDRQEPGRYRLEQRADAAWFGYSLGPQSWKRHLYPSQSRLFAAAR